MDVRLLEDCLAKGLSLEAIGKHVERHPSTVAYWLKKHGLSATGKVRYTPKGNIDQDRLRLLVKEGASIRRIAEDLDTAYSTVRY